MNRISKYLLIALSILLGSQISVAQNFKMIESSAKDAPKWVNNLERGYITASASKPTVDEAQEAVLLGVKQQIAQSIVSNISVEVMQTSVMYQDNNGAAYSSTSRDMVKSTTDKIPFLQSISLSKAADFYWEKYYDKKSKETRIDYYIKYQFTDRELNDLVAEFNAAQAKINKTIEQMATELETFTQVEDIAKNMGILRALIPEFAEGDPRIAVIDGLNNRYRDQYKYISIEQVEASDKRVVLQPYLSGRKVSTAQVPTHKSNGADRITKRVSGGQIEVTYDDYVCKAGDDNWIDLTFRFGSQVVKYRINIIK